MRLFVYEYTCAAGTAADPPALLAEGRAMLLALLEDLARRPGGPPITLLGPAGRVPAGPWVAHTTSPHHHDADFRRLARSCDATLLIAPESGGRLEHLARTADQAGAHRLGPTLDAIRLTADKLRLGQHLHARGIPCPPARPLAAAPPADMPYPAVCKPRDGAGSQATFLLRQPSDWPQCQAAAHSEGWHGEAVIQPFIPGRPVSVAALLGPGQCITLPPAEQVLSADGRFHYLGGRLPLPRSWHDRAAALAGRALAAVPGLLGYVGVDLVLGDDPTGDRVIEINPRLTTSYVGLRRLARFNLAALMLDTLAGKTTAPPAWNPGPVHFRADGTLDS